MRRAQRRTWIKLHCYGRLHGSVSFQLEPDERSVWDELLCLAGLCGLDGLIADNDMRPYPHSFIAHELHVPLELLERTLEKCKDEGRISENGHGISITNWKHYQSEYDRQKPYRQRKKKPSIDKQNKDTVQPEKKPYGEFKNVLLTEDQYAMLERRFSYETPNLIERLSGYIESKGKDPYKSHYATILNWARKDQKEAHGKTKHHSRELPKIYTEIKYDDD